MVGAGPRKSRSSSDVVGGYVPLVVVSKDASLDAPSINLPEGVVEADIDAWLEVCITSVEKRVEVSDRGDVLSFLLNLVAVSFWARSSCLLCLVVSRILEEIQWILPQEFPTLSLS